MRLWLSETIFVVFNIHLVPFPVGQVARKVQYFRQEIAGKLDKEIDVSSFQHMLCYELIKTGNEVKPAQLTSQQLEVIA